MVRDDLKKSEQKSEERTDAQVSVVRAGLRNSMNTTAELISKTKTALGAAIAKVGKPDPPEQAKPQFSLWGNGQVDVKTSLLFWSLNPDKDGVFSVDWNFVITSGVPASVIDYWIYVCEDYSFSKEPTGFDRFDRPAGLDEHARHRNVPGTLHPVSTFQICFNYSCGNRGHLKDVQKATIIVLPQYRCHSNNPLARMPIGAFSSVG
jgi:hypothetical protein